MTTKSASTPAIESLKFSELVIDPIYSGRTKKEIESNAVELAPQLANGWDAAQPGQYFVRDDGKKVLIAGFTRVAAAKENNLKVGYFVQANGDEVSHLTACLRTNSGKAISRHAQGERFVLLRDGAIDEEATAKALKDCKVGEEPPTIYKRQPMTLEEIGALPGVGKTNEHVRQCCLLVESSPEMQELMLAEKVADNVVIKSKQLASKGGDDNDALQLKLIKKAIAYAKADGKDCATLKYLDMAKAEVFPKKLIADAPQEPEKPAKASKTTEKEEKPAGEAPGASAGPSSDTREEPEAPLFTETSEPKSKVKSKDARAALIVIISKWADDTANSPSDDEMEKLADAIIEANLPL